MTQALEPGLEGSVGMTVGPADLASALGSGDVAVLGTPRLVALAEAATVAALAGVLDPGRTSVGTRVDLRHLAPTVEGRRCAPRPASSRWMDARSASWSR